VVSADAWPDVSVASVASKRLTSSRRARFPPAWLEVSAAAGESAGAGVVAEDEASGAESASSVLTWRILNRA